MKKWIGIFLLLLVLNQTTFALNGGWYASAIVGGTSYVTDKSSMVSTGPGWPPDKYVTNHSGDQLNVGVNVGYTWPYGCVYFPYLSLIFSYQYGFKTDIKGNELQQYTLPEFNNYSFAFQVQRQTILAALKANLIKLDRFMPFITAGAGYSYNRFSHFRETPFEGVTPRVSPGFSSHQQVYPSFIIGVGFDVILQERFLATFEYNYASLGYARSGFGTNPPTVTGVDYSQTRVKFKLDANILQLSLSYAIC